MLVNSSKQRHAEGLKGSEAHVAIRRRLRGTHNRSELPWSRLGEIFRGLSRQPRQDEAG